MHTWLQTFLLFLAIALGGAVAFAPRIGEPLPLVADEYSHIASAQQFLAEGTLFENPYIASEEPFLNLESGFHVFLAGLFALLGDDAVFYYRYLVVIFFVINALLLFLLVRNWSDYWAALFAVLFFGTFTSTNAIFAHEFFLPLTLGITLLLAAFLALSRWIQSQQRQYGYWLGAILLAAAVTYPPTLFFFLGAVILFLLSMDHALPESLQLSRPRFFMLLLLVLAAGGGLFVWVLYHLSLLQHIAFSLHWDIAHTRISPFFYFGAFASIFALLGLLTVLRRGHGPAKLSLYWFIYALGAIYVFYLFDVSILVPFPRLVLFYLIGASILAGIGAAALCRFLVRRSGAVVGIALFSLFFAAVLTSHYVDAFSTDYPYPDLLDDTTYERLMELAEHDADAVVIADGLHSRIIYPLAGHHIVGLLSSNIGGGDPVTAQRFLTGSCEEKVLLLEQLRRYLPSSDTQLFVLARTQQDCPFLVTTNTGAPYLYTFKIDALAHERVAYAAQFQPSLHEIDLPSADPLNEEAIRSLFQEMRFSGDDWTERYAADGSIRGQGDDGRYGGFWSVSGPVFCYYYAATDVRGCRSIATDGDTAIFYDLDGNEVATARMRPVDRVE